MFGKGRRRKASCQRISHILRTCAFQQLDVAMITHELPQKLESNVVSEMIDEKHFRVPNLQIMRKVVSEMIEEKKDEKTYLHFNNFLMDGMSIMFCVLTITLFHCFNIPNWQPARLYDHVRLSPSITEHSIQVEMAVIILMLLIIIIIKSPVTKDFWEVCKCLDKKTNKYKGAPLWYNILVETIVNILFNVLVHLIFGHCIRSEKLCSLMRS